jgi:hypothetical protein
LIAALHYYETTVCKRAPSTNSTLSSYRPDINLPPKLKLSRKYFRTSPFDLLKEIALSKQHLESMFIFREKPRKTAR